MTVLCLPQFINHLLNTDIISRSINKELHSINKWFVTNKIYINATKTKCMLFSYKSDISLPLTKIDHLKLSEVESAKFLVMYCAKCLKFDHHIKQINTKLSKSVGILYKIHKYLPINTLKLLNHTFIQPYISHRIEAWYNADITYTNNILIIQQKAIRLICKIPRSHYKLF